MGQITGGRILFGDANKHNPADQYSLSRKAEAEFSFAGAEGEAIEGVCEQAMNLARAKVAEMLSGKAVAVVTTAAAGDANKAKVAAELGSEPGTKIPRKPRTPPAATAVDDMAEAEQVKTIVAEALKPTPANDAAAMDDDLLGTGPAQITDAELTDKIRLKNGELIQAGHKTSPVEIKALIASMFKPEELPKQAREIPMALRPGFLAELAAIKAPTT